MTSYIKQQLKLTQIRISFKKMWKYILQRSRILIEKFYYNLSILIILISGQVQLSVEIPTQDKPS